MFILASADLSLMKDSSPNSKAQMQQYCLLFVVVVVVVKVLSPGCPLCITILRLFAVLDMLLFWVED